VDFSRILKLDFAGGFPVYSMCMRECVLCTSGSMCVACKWECVCVAYRWEWACCVQVKVCVLRAQVKVKVCVLRTSGSMCVACISKNWKYLCIACACLLFVAY